MQTITFSPAAPRDDSRGQRVLILDQNMILASSTRYASRTLAHIRISDVDDHYSEYLPSFEVPQAFAEVAELLDEHPQHVPIAATRELTSDFYAKVGPAIPAEHWQGHGLGVFTFIADRVPDAQFVIGQHAAVERLAIPDFCRLVSATASERAAAIDDLEQRLGAIGDSLADIVELYDIDYINASWGLTGSLLQTIVSTKCGASLSSATKKAVLKRERAFMKGLSELTYADELGQTRSAILVHAGVTAPHPLTGTEGDYSIDCGATMPGRIRVNAFSYLGSDIPVEGSDDLALVDAPALNAKACTDVYINAGYEPGLPPVERTPSLRYSDWGIGDSWNPWPPSSSFMAPVAIARLVSLRQELGQDSAAPELLDAWTANGARPLQDPILHDQFVSADGAP